MAIKRQENRDGFVVTEYTKVCEQHFRPEEIKKQFSGRKDLKDKTIIPPFSAGIKVRAHLIGITKKEMF